MKNKQYLLLIIFFFFFICNASALETTARAYITSGCNIRTGPGTQNSKIASGYTGAYYNLVEDKTYTDTNNHSGCNSDWYQIYYNGSKKAYVCGDHVDVVRSYSKDDVAPATTCEQEMSKLGFPSSYWGGLCSLKERHPNWTFVAMDTGVTWEYAVNEESPCGKNFIYDNSVNKSFIDTTCTKHDASYVAILPAGVAYYMDPRNFLSDRFIFQFEHLGYVDTFTDSYKIGVEDIISGAEFYKYHKTNGKDLAEAITSVAKEINASPISISSRILNELGTGEAEKVLYSGIYDGYDNKYVGYYNFFNYGVSGDCVAQNGIAYCGLNYAFNNGWNSVEAAIKGGMNSIAKNYINKNQYTNYFQKFNALGSSTYPKFTHQYQTNIQAPMSESTINYNTYSKLGILESRFIFYIPVYQNMDTIIINSGGGANESDDPTNPSTIPIHTIVTSSGYKYTKGYIYGIKPGTNVKNVKGNLESVGGNSTVVITNLKGETVYDDTIGTGYKITINNQSTTEVLEAVIKGDTSGDGIINALDLLQVQKNILGTYNLNGASKIAADTSLDDKINALDLLQVQKNILGTFEIEQ